MPVEWYGLDGNPISDAEADDLLKDVEARRVARTVLYAERRQVVIISTVFLVLNHAWDGGSPELWETLTMGGPLDQTMDRYRSASDAVRGHNDTVTFTHAALDAANVAVLAEESYRRGDVSLTYYRSRDGHKVHRADCPRRGTGQRWTLATGMTPLEVTIMMDGYPWLRWCAYCQPTTAIVI